jgi:hypothetical protein
VKNYPRDIDRVGQLCFAVDYRELSPVPISAAVAMLAPKIVELIGQGCVQVEVIK